MFGKQSVQHNDESTGLYDVSSKYTHSAVAKQKTRPLQMIVPWICHFNAASLPYSINVHVGTAVILQVDKGLGVSRFDVWVSENGVLGLYPNLSADAKRFIMDSLLGPTNPKVK